MANDRQFPFPLNPMTVIKDIRRVRDIVTVLARHGFGQLVVALAKTEAYGVGPLIRSFQVPAEGEEPTEPTTAAARLRLVFQDLGPTFIKLGQVLSTRPDLIPEEYAAELKKLQDDVPPFEFADARRQIETELGRPLTELFETFDETPLGTASIGQVYAARLKSGEDVVVKVQRPGVQATIESDIDLMLMLARALETRFPRFKPYDMTGILQEFSKAIRRELDYTTELRNALKFAEIFRQHPEVVVPRVFKRFSTRRVLTMERIRGVKIDLGETIGDDKKTLARVALQAVLVMVFEAGFFHADPHPGNIFALEGNRIAFLDLGMVGRLDEGMRFRLADLIVALLERDVDEIGRILMMMGIREGKVNQARLRRDIAEVMDKIVGLPLEEIQFSEILTDLLEGARRHHLKVPNEYTLMGKALLTIEGLGKELDPSLDIEAAVAPFIQKLVLARYSPKHLRRTLVKRLNEFYHWSHELPTHVMTILDDLQAGDLRIKVEQLEQGRLMRNLEGIAGKISAALVISALILSSSLLLTFTRFEYLVFGVPAGLFLGIVGYVGAAFLGLRMIRAVVKERDPDDS